MAARSPIDAHARAIGALFDAATAQIQAVIAEGLTSGAAANAKWLEAQRAYVAAITARLAQQAPALAHEAVLRAYLAAHEDAAKVLKIKAPPNERSAQLLAENASKPLGDAALTVGRRADDALRRIGLAQAAQADVKGEGIRDPAARLAADLQARGLVATGKDGAKLVQVGGRNFQAGKYAEMVIRTTTREAHSHAVIEQTQAAGSDLVEVSSHGASDECGDYEGNVYSLDGTTPGYDVLDQVPPFHPNCVHVLAPVAP